MGKVVFIEPIDHISGKIAKRHKVSFSHRTAPTSNTGNPNFTSWRSPRSTQPKAAELARRTRFAAISKAVQLRKVDFSKNTQDQENFLAQSQYKTFHQYLWHVCAQEYDQAQGA